MTPQRPLSPHTRASTPGRRAGPRRRRALVAAAVVAALCLLAVACGGETTDTSVRSDGTPAAVSEEVAEANAAYRASRPGSGITAAGGSVNVGPACPAPGSPGAAETVKIALTTPDVFDLEVIGLANLVFDDPAHIIDAYINKVNSFGGVNGHCFEFVSHVYGFTDPVGDFGRICTELPQQAPLTFLGLGLSDDPILQCGTLGAQLPTIGLYAQFPDAIFAEAGELLRVDHGAVEFLLQNAMGTAFEAGALAADEAVGLLYQEGASAASEQATFEATSGLLGLQVAATLGVPPEFSGTPVLVIEQMFREAGGEILDPDTASFEQALEAMPPDLAGLLGQIRGHFLAAAAEMRDAGVTTVIASGDWADVRNLMRAAELSAWFPTWIINDAHYAFLILTDAPVTQGLNMIQVSSRRAADDPIDGLDRGCLSLRNAETTAEPFAYRFHTDAWNLMASTCDYLDVVFSAISRVDGPLTRDSFLAALSETDYRAAHGQDLRFSADDMYGSDSFRLLRADPDCVLNQWGCMRPVTDWFPPAAGVAAGSEGGAGSG